MTKDNLLIHNYRETKSIQICKSESATPKMTTNNFTVSSDVFNDEEVQQHSHAALTLLPTQTMTTLAAPVPVFEEPVAAVAPVAHVVAAPVVVHFSVKRRAFFRERGVEMVVPAKRPANFFAEHVAAPVAPVVAAPVAPVVAAPVAPVVAAPVAVHFSLRRRAFFEERGVEMVVPAKRPANFFAEHVANM